MVKKIVVASFLSLFLVFASFSLSFADPSGLIIVRASDGSLWKATCIGLSCSGFTNFPGNFASEPSVYWDDNLQLYVCWGRASNNTIWRSTFTRAGAFNNDWVNVPGLTASPLGAAGGGLALNMNSQLSSNMDGVELTSTITNIKSMSVYAPYDGFVICQATGAIEHYRSSATGTNFARIYLTDTSGGTQVSWVYTDVPSTTPAGMTSFPFAESRWFGVSEGYNTFYLTGEEGGSAAATTTTTVRAVNITYMFFPYSY